MREKYNNHFVLQMCSGQWRAFYESRRAIGDFLTADLAKSALDEVKELHFTNTEKRVFALTAMGCSSAESAAKMQISERTVIFHKENIRKKTGAKTTMAAVLDVLLSGTIDAKEFKTLLKSNG